MNPQNLLGGVILFLFFSLGIWIGHSWSENHKKAEKEYAEGNPSISDSKHCLTYTKEDFDTLVVNGVVDSFSLPVKFRIEPIDTLVKIETTYPNGMKPEATKESVPKTYYQNPDPKKRCYEEYYHVKVEGADSAWVHITTWVPKS